jgi:hypothetical protein
LPSPLSDYIAQQQDPGMPMYAYLTLTLAGLLTLVTAISMALGRFLS